MDADRYRDTAALVLARIEDVPEPLRQPIRELLSAGGQALSAAESRSVLMELLREVVDALARSDARGETASAKVDEAVAKLVARSDELKPLVQRILDERKAEAEAQRAEASERIEARKLWLSRPVLGFAGSTLFLLLLLLSRSCGLGDLPVPPGMGVLVEPRRPRADALLGDATPQPRRSPLSPPGADRPAAQPDEVP